MYHFPIERSKGTSHFEKEFYDIIRLDIRNLGAEQAHDIWGTFAYDTIPRTSTIGDTLYNLEFPQEYTYWGNSDEDLQDILVALDDSNGDFGDNDNDHAF